MLEEGERIVMQADPGSDARIEGRNEQLREFLLHAPLNTLTVADVDFMREVDVANQGGEERLSFIQGQGIEWYRDW